MPGLRMGVVAGHGRSGFSRPTARVFAIDLAWQKRHMAGIGALAQLGERVVRNDEVRGSIPLGSTNLTFGLVG